MAKMIKSNGQVNFYLGSVEEVTGGTVTKDCPEGSVFYAYKGQNAPKVYMFDEENKEWVEQ